MILAAGRGARMRDLTDERPKPLLEVHGRSLIAHQIARLRAGGFDDLVINIGYHGENPNPLQLPLDAFGLGMNDKAIHTGLCPGGSERMKRLLRLLESGRIDPTPMTTHTFGFDRIGEAFSMMITKDDGIVKPLITFD